MVIAPVIFCTVALGIAHMSDLKKFGRVGGKALIYFEVVSTLALVIGLVGRPAGRSPGAGFNIDPATLDPSIAAELRQARPRRDSVVDHLLHIIPDTFFGAFAGGDLLQVLLVAILTGFACTRLGDVRRPGRRRARQTSSKVFFSIIHIVVRLAPIGAFGAMAFTIGKYGAGLAGPARRPDRHLLPHLAPVRGGGAGR